MKRVCAVSIDLDPIRCYYEIHGLGQPSTSLDDVILRRALPRFTSLFAKHGVVATFFVVARDLEKHTDPVRALAASGHEIANHTYGHPYDLLRRTKREIEKEVSEAHARIQKAVGRAPVGFRSPGYGVTSDLIEVLERLGYLYDSSFLPSPSYYAAKACIMTALKVMGSPSRSHLGDPRGLLAPAVPYRPSRRSPWRRGQSTLLELPVAVTPWLRVPAIGTLMVTAPTGVRARVLESMRSRGFFNLELHGIDLIDAELDGVPAELVARQPDLRRPLAHKVRALAATLERLSTEYEFISLREVAARFEREGERHFA